MDLFDNIEIKTENHEIEILTELKQKAKDYQQSLLNALSQNKLFVSELAYLKNTEAEKRIIVTNNEILISQIKINLKVAQDKYEALVKEKDNQFQMRSKEISELADINTTVAISLMEQLGFEIKLNYMENNIWEVKYLFCNNKQITLNYNVPEGTFSLQSMIPSPMRFDLMKEFLNSTQDISGFLYTANKYFLKLHNKTNP